MKTDIISPDDTSAMIDFVPRRSRSYSFPPLGSPQAYSFIEGFLEVVFRGPLNLLLLCVPLIPLCYYFELDDSIIFVLSLLAIAPVAERLGYITEQLAMHTSDTIGGLLNATFGNLTELIVGMSALRKGLFRLVQLSLLGSILSNILLVLGTAFFIGGLRFKSQRHGKITSQINSSLLMVAVMGLLFPNILTVSDKETTMGELALSRGAAIILLALYLGFLYYQLFVPQNGYNTNATLEAEPLLPQTIPRSYSNPAEDDSATDDEETERDQEKDTLGLAYGLLWLGAVTLVISYLSDRLVESVTAAAESLQISSIFLSAIVIPIIGNAAEHASAITFGYKNRLELSLAIAVGSSTQIALMVLPLLTIVGWIIDKPMSFNFSSYESTTLLLSIILVTFALKDGKSNWLLGLILIGAYGLIALGFWAHTDESL